MKTMKNWNPIKKEVTGLLMAKFKPSVSKGKNFIYSIDFTRKSQRSWENITYDIYFSCQDHTQAVLRNIESII